MAASLVIFVHMFLRIAFWHGLMRMLFTVWIIAQLTLVAVAVIDPRLASTFARMSFVGIGAVGGAFALFLALRGQDRALSLHPDVDPVHRLDLRRGDGAHRAAVGRCRGLRAWSPASCSSSC